MFSEMSRMNPPQGSSESVTLHLNYESPKVSYPHHCFNSTEKS